MLKTKFVERLCDKAFFVGHMIGSAHEPRVQHAIQEGTGLPEECKPGRLIMSLSPEERELVKTLKAKDFDHRIK